MSEDFKKKFDDILNNVKKELDSISKKVDEHLEKGEVQKAYKVWRDAVLDLLKSLRNALDTIGEEFKDTKFSESDLQDIAKYVREGVREIIDRLEGIGNKIKEFKGRGYLWVWLDFKPIKHVFREVAEGVNLTVDGILNHIEKFVNDLEKTFEDTVRRTTQVVSVRIKEKDLEIVDKLVEAGIFKSRSEAVAFFTRRGIESSKDWIEKALEHARKIKELQEAIRREIEGEEEDSGKQS
ncbi:MAG: ribbon-helix-helix domain-containing protein [Ignisphaera sp.]